MYIHDDVYTYRVIYRERENWDIPPNNSALPPQEFGQKVL